MNVLIHLAITCVSLKIVLAAQCAKINFNDGELKLQQCPEERKKSWLVENFTENTDFPPRNEKTTNFISKSNTSWDGVCGETDEYEADENSFVDIGYFLIQLDVQGYIEFKIELLVDGKEIQSEVFGRTDSASNWRNFSMPVTKSGSAKIRISLGLNPGGKVAVDFINFHNSNMDDEDCKPDSETTSTSTEVGTSWPESTTSSGTTTPGITTETQPGVTTTADPNGNVTTEKPVEPGCPTHVNKNSTKTVTTTTEIKEVTSDGEVIRTKYTKLSSETITVVTTSTITDGTQNDDFP